MVLIILKLLLSITSFAAIALVVLEQIKVIKAEWIHTSYAFEKCILVWMLLVTFILLVD